MLRARRSPRQWAEVGGDRRARARAAWDPRAVGAGLRHVAGVVLGHLDVRRRLLRARSVGAARAAGRDLGPARSLAPPAHRARRARLAAARTGAAAAPVRRGADDRLAVGGQHDPRGAWCCVAAPLVEPAVSLASGARGPARGCHRSTRRRGRACRSPGRSASARSRPRWRCAGRDRSRLSRRVRSKAPRSRRPAVPGAGPPAEARRRPGRARAGALPRPGPPRGGRRRPTRTSRPSRPRGSARPHRRFERHPGASRKSRGSRVRVP